MLGIGLELAKTQVETEHKLEEYKRALGMPSPQDAQSAALLQLMQGMEALSAQINQPHSGLRAAQSTVDVSAMSEGRQRQAVAGAGGFTEPEYNTAWSESPDESAMYEEVVID